MRILFYNKRFSYFFDNIILLRTYIYFGFNLFTFIDENLEIGLVLSMGHRTALD